MKNKFRSRRKYRFGFAGRALLTLALVLGLLGASLFPSNAEEENPGRAAGEQLDLQRLCSLTVTGNKTVTSEELIKVGVVVDLYKVADLEDGYFFKQCSAFTNLTISNDMNTKEWADLAQEAAEIALSNTGGADVVQTGVKIGEGIQLPAGLYLLIARGGEMQDYVDRNTDGEIVTKAVADGCTYIFSPVLVSLPGRELSGDSTQFTEKWVYNQNVVLKVERKTDEEYGSLKIVKTLTGTDTGTDPVTFIFDVEAELNSVKVYSNVVTIVFDGPGKQELTIEGIPIGAVVTVKEVYTGARCTLVTDGTQTVTIPLEGIASVEFTNKYDGDNGGQSIVNHFTPSPEKNEWGWEKLPNQTKN